MGFFSWKTADTNESIMNNNTSECRDVYMLQPDGKPPIHEPSYDGFGDFGGIDAYEWISEMNLGIKDRDLGISIIYGANYYQINGVNHVVGESKVRLMNILQPDIPVVRLESYSSTVDGKSLNEWMGEKGVEQSMNAFIKYHLKFSFNPNADYESLPSSKDCPKQGFDFSSSLDSGY